MDIAILLSGSKVAIAIASMILGIITTVAGQKWLSRRALFIYSVSHQQLGASTEDTIYGSVKITWNEIPVSNLYLSSVELINQSAQDFEAVIVRIFTINTRLLTQKNEVVGTTRILDFTDEYKEKIAVVKGSQPTEFQIDLYRHQRDYIVSTMNRRQIVRFYFLNTAETGTQPEIWLEVLHKGVNCKFKNVYNQYLGVERPMGALVGALMGLLIVGLIMFYVGSSSFIALISYFIGLFVLLPGAYTVKVYRKLRDWFTG